MFKILILGLYLTVYYLRPQNWVTPLLEYRLQFYLGSIAFIVIIFHYLTVKKIDSKEKTDNFNLMFLSFIIVLIFSKVLTGWLGGSFAVFYRMLPTIVGFYMVSITCTTISRWNNIVFLLILLTSFIALQACIQIETGTAIGGLKPGFRAGINEDGYRILLPQAKWWGILRDPNDLGMALTAVLPFMFNKIHQNKILYIPPLVVTLAAIYFTNSRGTILGTIVAIGLFYVLRKRSLKGLIVAGIIGALILILGPSRVNDIGTGDSSTQSRLEAWYVGFQLFKANPFFGVGTDTFNDYHNLTAHNTYVLLLAETGFIGLSLFTIVMGIPLYSAFRIIYEIDNDAERSDLAATTSSLGALCFTIIFISRPYILQPYLYSVLTISYLRIKEHDRFVRFISGVKLKYIIGAVVGQIILFYAMVRFL